MADPETAKDTKTDPEEVEDVDEGSEEVGEDGRTAAGDNITNQYLQNPQVLAAIQSKLGSMVGAPSGYIASLPKVVKRRIKALKKLQFEATKIEADFYVQVHKLECEYAAKYAPLYDKRKEIVTGSTEPTEDECDWPSDEEEEEEAIGEEAKLSNTQEALKDKVKVEDEKKDEAKTEAKAEEDPSGIPQFWLTIFKNVDMLTEYIQDHDEPILQHLTDITVKYTDPVSSVMGFTLYFHFEPNDYFTNTVLTKEYTMRSDPDETDPFSFEGPEIVKCKGCTIDWKKGKDVTVKAIKKKQKHKGRGTTRTVTKTVKNESFFHFFNPPAVPEGDDVELDEEVEAQLTNDFEIGHFIRERLVPRAVLYFTGEALDDEEYEDDGMEDEDGDDEEDDENDPDYEPKGDRKTPGECKQQ
ncbi:nucleosome assembly protein 1-like 1 isoform X3 [Liolophura sinensis]|uniref:nucleosome assembly protein 1-like 1 isoform X3 n=1 Tax=Liolophura sinensis TaxID=3198878 RepID=UPI0031599438